MKRHAIAVAITTALISIGVGLGKLTYHYPELGVLLIVALIYSAIFIAVPKKKHNN